MTGQNPADWFEQFVVAEPAGWSHDQWCWRHWAPCPLLGGNGILASLLVIMETTALMPDDVVSPRQRDAWTRSVGKLCCRLGDDEMYVIWGKCPPAPATDAGT